MSGLLRGILSAAEVVAGVAMEFVPGGQLAGAMLITAGIGSSGLIGGSIGKFLNSGVGQGLMGAMAMGAGAAYTYGVSAAQSAANVANISASAAQDAQAAVTSVDNLNNAAVSKSISQIASQDPQSFLGATGTDPGSVAGAYPPGTPAAPIPTSSVAATYAANTAVATAATDAQGAAGKNLINGPAGGPAAGATANTPGAAPAPLVGSTQPGAPGGAGLANPMAQPSTATVPPPSTGVGGMLSNAVGKVGSYIGNNPGVAVAGGQALSGLAQGAAAEKTMQEQLAAQQWGNLQWQNPAEVSQLQSAAAQPITVPQGYLQRAQAVRGMMGATPSAPVGGVQPMAIAGAAPGAPLAPKLPGQA